jgi:hypothetical protein
VIIGPMMNLLSFRGQIGGRTHPHRSARRRLLMRFGQLHPAAVFGYLAVFTNHVARSGVQTKGSAMRPILCSDMVHLHCSGLGLRLGTPVPFDPRAVGFAVGEASSGLWGLGAYRRVSPNTTVAGPAHRGIPILLAIPTRRDASPPPPVLPRHSRTFR